MQKPTTLFFLGLTFASVFAAPPKDSRPIVIISRPYSEVSQHQQQTPGAEERIEGLFGGGGGLFDFEFDDRITQMLTMMPWAFNIGYPPMPLVPPPMYMPNMLGGYGAGIGNYNG